MSLKDKIQEFRKFSRLDDERLEGRARKVPKSKMDTPVQPPRKGRASSTKTAEVDGKESSHRNSRKAWKGIEYWLRDHGVPSYQIGSLDRETPVRESTEMDLMRAVAGITERERFCEAPAAAPAPGKKTVKRVKMTRPEREYRSGSGNQSGMPRSAGTGQSGGYEEPARDGEFDEPEDQDSEMEPEDEEEEDMEEACCASCAQGDECEDDCEDEDEYEDKYRPEARLSPRSMSALLLTLRK